MFSLLNLYLPSCSFDLKLSACRRVAFASRVSGTLSKTTVWDTCLNVKDVGSMQHFCLLLSRWSDGGLKNSYSDRFSFLSVLRVAKSDCSDPNEAIPTDRPK